MKILIAEPLLGEKELEYVAEAIKSGWISSKGRYVTEFEEGFSKYCGARYSVATSSGTTALHLALATLEIKAGDEVIIPTLTMIATANSVAYTGAKPILIDSEPKTWNMDPRKIEGKITEKTKAIMVVHTYGHPVDMDLVLEVAKKHDLWVIEDAAEAHGAEYKGRRVGALGDLGCFSFYANKIITTGEGGMITTNNEELAERARKLRDQAYEKEKRFWHKSIGFNYRMTNLQAAVGVGQMTRIDEFVVTRRRNADTYNSLLRNIPGITTPPQAPWAKNVYWMYSILVDDDFGVNRDTLKERLREKGVDTRTFFYPIHVQPVYADLYRGEKYPIAEELSRCGLNLPSGNSLRRDEIEYVVESLLSARES